MTYIHVANTISTVEVTSVERDWGGQTMAYFSVLLQHLLDEKPSNKIVGASPEITIDHFSNTSSGH